MSASVPVRERKRDAKAGLVQLAPKQGAGADRLEAADRHEPPLCDRPMIGQRANECGLALLYIAAAPLLLFAATLMIIASKLALAIFRRDPVGELAERHPEAWALLALTGRCTLGLLVAGLLVRAAF